jgi:hypothetical protein
MTWYDGKVEHKQDLDRGKIIWTDEDEDGFEQTHELPATRVICSNCDGKGHHVNRAIDGHGISPEEFHRDPEFMEDYFNGVFDVQCDECRGAKIVLEVNRNTCDPELLKKWDAAWKDAAEARAEYEAERRARA